MYREWMEKGPRMQIFSVELLFQFFYFFFTMEEKLMYAHFNDSRGALFL